MVHKIVISLNLEKVALYKSDLCVDNVFWVVLSPGTHSVSSVSRLGVISAWGAGWPGLERDQGVVAPCWLAVQGWSGLWVRGPGVHTHVTAPWPSTARVGSGQSSWERAAQALQFSQSTWVGLPPMLSRRGAHTPWHLKILWSWRVPTDPGNILWFTNLLYIVFLSCFGAEAAHTALSYFSGGIYVQV